jgi:hypothetical protein
MAKLSQFELGEGASCAAQLGRFAQTLRAREKSAAGKKRRGD